MTELLRAAAFSMSGLRYKDPLDPLGASYGNTSPHDNRGHERTADENNAAFAKVHSAIGAAVDAALAGNVGTARRHFNEAEDHSYDWNHPSKVALRRHITNAKKNSDYEEMTYHGTKALALCSKIAKGAVE